MLKYYFSRLPFTIRFEYIKEFGTFLAHRKEDGISINLYYVAQFYVEISFTTDTNFIKDIKTIEPHKAFDDYIDQINIEDLF